MQIVHSICVHSILPILVVGVQDLQCRCSRMRNNNSSTVPDDEPQSSDHGVPDPDPYFLDFRIRIRTLLFLRNLILPNNKQINWENMSVLTIKPLCVFAKNISLYNEKRLLLRNGNCRRITNCVATYGLTTKYKENKLQYVYYMYYPGNWIVSATETGLK